VNKLSLSDELAYFSVFHIFQQLKNKECPQELLKPLKQRLYMLG